MVRKLKNIYNSRNDLFNNLKLSPSANINNEIISALDDSNNNHQATPIKILDFVNDFNSNSDIQKQFPSQSYGYNASENGLEMSAIYNNGTYQGSELRGFNLPFKPNEYAETTFKVPHPVYDGIDFSFWFYNYINDSSKDHTEFDVDEINHGQNHISNYSQDNKHNSFLNTDIGNNFDNDFHTLGVKYQNNHIVYYLDGKIIMDKQIKNIDSMFPVWSVEVPKGNDFHWTGQPNPNDFPCNVLIIDYKVYNL